jgi:ubiquinone/menaquinone biosynthesis C-methylase UbiE
MNRTRREAEMTTQEQTVASGTDGTKTTPRKMWALGDYHRFAKNTVWKVGPVVVEACGITAGQDVLDVAAGTGNVAIRAAQAGARVVASDLTPENFESGRREAAACGVEIDWVEADAEALPFVNGTFDVVTSSFGAMFAPDHERVAHEMLRVCRPAGTIGIASFTPDGTGAAFFATLGAYLPPPPASALPPLLWGDESHLRELFGDRVESLELSRRTYLERSASPATYLDLFCMTFGPIVGLRRALSADPDRAAALDRDLAEFATRFDQGAPGGLAEYEYGYLLAIARKRA